MKSSALAFTALSLVMAVAVGLFSIREPDPSKIHIGAPDDSGGLIVHYILHGRGFTAAEVVGGFEACTLKDCCASTSEWALSTDRLHMAIMCPEAARRLVEKDSRFHLIGPSLLNSEVVLVRPGIVPRKIGIAQKRRHQEMLVDATLPQGCISIPMIPAALPYAYERRIVDGVVLDILKAFAIRAERIPSATSGSDLVTYVLVTRKDFSGSPLYRRFMDAYEKAAGDLADPRILGRAVEAYRSIPWTNQEADDWKSSRVKFVSPLKARP